MIKKEIKKSKKGLIFFIIGFTVLFLLAFWEWLFFYMTNKDIPNGGVSDNIVFEIEKGESIKSVASRLEKDNLINSSFFFLTYLQRSGLDKTIQAGEYVLSGNESILSLADKLQKATEKSISIRFLEGWSNKDITNYFDGKGLDGVSFVNCLKNCKFDNKYITDEVVKYLYEGYLFPDTYQIKADASHEQIINKALDNFELKVDSIYSELENKKVSDADKEIVNYANSHSLFEIITVASMIEREVRTEKDRPVVSGIIWNRLKNDMSLGIDATFLYMLGDWDAILTYDVLNTESPYNTRKNIGLIPSPICQPSYKSIYAAFFPQDSEYLYYLTNEEGAVFYGKTLEEHNINKSKYL